jgi:RND family efflux transporter MFP subunit
MQPTCSDNGFGSGRGPLVRVALCLIALTLGVGGMLVLAAQKTPPGKAASAERALRVEAWKVEPEDVPVEITGYGVARPLYTVSLSAEVSGRVVHVHPRLEVGEVIAEKEVLFRIDEVNYRSALRRSRAAAAQRREQIRRLKKERDIDAERLKTLRRTRDLAEAEFRRLKELFEADDVGTRSGVEAAEQAYNRAADQADLMARTLAVYPQRIKEAESALAQVVANLELARANLQRCTVRAPFTGRVTRADIERDQYVTPGQPAVGFADDSVLELRVQLDSREARKWLRFDDRERGAGSAWFSGLQQVACPVRWVESRNDHVWTGLLHRVVDFEARTRTLTVAVRVTAREAASGNAALPLVEGMFCSVAIPGKTLKDVFKLPREAVSFENTVYASRDGRLQTVRVEVAHAQGDYAYIASGLRPGEVVVTTRLIDPLENALLKITSLRRAGEAS